MKNPHDTSTADLIGGIPKKRGRPRLYASAAERVAAHRARHDTVRLDVDLPRELVEQFEAWLQFKDLTKREVIEKLLRTQLLRKR